ncbi:unnamed protein product [Prorocentrum cordatum]|uniref:ubiquitinyl hydrolase 1 n=1 Tax=Prorocentrum cordatum TaxID=2364126 RepID=A0ABN9Q4Y7_9DINO|nr:unnamed protein product [Polarella glacialis]
MAPKRIAKRPAATGPLEKFRTLWTQRFQLPGWGDHDYALSWEDGFSQLEAWLQEHRDTYPAMPPASRYAPAERRLWKWLKRERDAFHRAPATYPPEKRLKLQSLPGWEWTPADMPTCPYLLDPGVGKRCHAPATTTLLGVPYCDAHARQFRGERMAVLDLCRHSDDNVLPHRGSAMTHQCQHCGAYNFSEELIKNKHFSICCQNGKLTTKQISLKLYNNAFSFVSYGSECFDTLASGRGPPVMICHGTVYHNAGFLFPQEGATPKCAQLYLYDHNVATQHRQGNAYYENLDADWLRRFAAMMTRVCPYVQTYRQMQTIAQQHHAPTVQLALAASKENDMRRYNKPQTLEPAVIFASGDGAHRHSKDIVVWPREEGYEAHRIHEDSEHVDPLAYPLLFPYGDPGPRWYLYLLLLHTPGARCWEDLVTATAENGDRRFFETLAWCPGTLAWKPTGIPDYKAACQARGLTTSDDEYKFALADAAHTKHARALRTLFAMALLHADVSNPLALFEEFADDLADDFARDHSTEEAQNMCLQALQDTLCQAGKLLSEFGLPAPKATDASGPQNRDLQRELDYVPRDEAEAAAAKRALLNEAQLGAYEAILAAVAAETPFVAFIDGRVEIFHLVENMRAALDKGWQRYLLDVGDGSTPFATEIGPQAIRLREDIVAPTGWGPADLAGHVFPDLPTQAQAIVAAPDAAEPLCYFRDRAILAPTNAVADAVNATLLEALPASTQVTYYSIDDIDAGTPEERNLWPVGYRSEVADADAGTYTNNVVWTEVLLEHAQAHARDQTDLQMRGRTPPFKHDNTARSFDPEQPRPDFGDFIDEASGAPPTPHQSPRQTNTDDVATEADEFGVVLSTAPSGNAHFSSAMHPPDTVAAPSAPARGTALPFEDVPGEIEGVANAGDSAADDAPQRFQGHFERQRGARCGLHAINNAVGYQLLNEGLLRQACALYLEQSAREGNIEHSDAHIDGDGNYSEALLSFALQWHHNLYELNLNNPFLEAEESMLRIYAPDVVGALINENNVHWSAIRTQEGRLWRLDSSQPKPIPINWSQFRNLITTFRKAQGKGQHNGSHMLQAVHHEHAVRFLSGKPSSIRAPVVSRRRCLKDLLSWEPDDKERVKSGCKEAGREKRVENVITNSEMRAAKMVPSLLQCI